MHTVRDDVGIGDSITSRVRRHDKINQEVVPKAGRQAETIGRLEERKAHNLLDEEKREKRKSERGSERRVGATRIATTMIF